MRTTLLTLALLVSGCSLLDGDADRFDDATLDVYEVAFNWLPGTAPTTGRMGVALIRSDIAPDDDEPDSGGGLSGVWELGGSDTEFPTGRGSARGGLNRDGRTFQVFLFERDVPGDVTDEGVLYELNGELDGGALIGTWTRIGSYGTGVLSGRLVRAATENVPVP